MMHYLKPRTLNFRLISVFISNL
uniref:Uncharacterized protein n=1 Tax=Rhizophora mucronata TaxID=61149 RepID=A0A2P2JHX0_RHIMU